MIRLPPTSILVEFVEVVGLAMVFAVVGKVPPVRREIRVKEKGD